jgi:hypothetical protein
MMKLTLDKLIGIKVATLTPHPQLTPTTSRWPFPLQLCPAHYGRVVEKEEKRQNADELKEEKERKKLADQLPKTVVGYEKLARAHVGGFPSSESTRTQYLSRARVREVWVEGFSGKLLVAVKPQRKLK